MNTTITEPEIWIAAKDAAGNWMKFESFGLMSNDIDQNWMIDEFGHRDEDVLTTSNREIIERELEEFCERQGGAVYDDWFAHSNKHWAFGYTNGFTMRIFHITDTKHPAVFISPVFEKYVELMKRLEEYPILDEDDFYKREHEDLLETIKNCWGGDVSENAPDDWYVDVASYLFDVHSVSSSEEVGDAEVTEALNDLGYLEKEEEDDDLVY